MGDRCIKVTHVSGLVTEEIMRQLFEILGEVEELCIPNQPDLKECEVKFKDSSAAKTALYLTGTELGDRKLMVTASFQALSAPPWQWPSGKSSPQSAGGSGTPGLSGARQPGSPLAGAAASASPSLPASLPQGITPSMFAMLQNNPYINPTVLHHDPLRAEAIARTVHVGNLPRDTVDADLREVFGVFGPIAHVKVAGDALQPNRYGFIEFAEMGGVHQAVRSTNVVLKGNLLKVSYSKNGITKPHRQIVLSAADDAMRMVLEAQKNIEKKYTESGGGSDGGGTPARRVSRSHSRSAQRRASRRRSVSRSRSRSPSQSRRRSRSRSRSRSRRGHRRRDSTASLRRQRQRSRSRSRDRYYSPRQRQDRSRGRDRSVSRDRYWARDRSRDRYRVSSRDRRRDRSREHSRDRRRNRSVDRRRELSRSRQRDRNRGASRDRRRGTSRGRSRSRSRSRGQDTRYRRRSTRPRSRSQSRPRTSKNAASVNSEQTMEWERTDTPKETKSMDVSPGSQDATLLVTAAATAHDHGDGLLRNDVMEYEKA
ncbi:hypothetical protein THASP1DRAFT_31266 [Thamnocephalis sphaerospora]|uniref:RRM domain-containing protein n=1 Tax=Thamnocephalis sphaerospora TaxID=78915 RepID=A0A4P9XM05_9FUNG|nr:hypothetical protein THASP1DRAFT_31266 [Thamnocephalis sphaerospora]|eukprot:RKP06923.1 hypothetical protein THASP1DRAFT_31266 [Thamnocephalis sphaerospora]